MILEKVRNIALLFDFYGSMLTQKQKEVVNLYVFNNLSFAEIAENTGTSRQAVKDLLDRSIEILTNYENQLGFVNKYQQTKQLLINTDYYNNFIKIWEE